MTYEERLQTRYRSDLDSRRRLLADRLVGAAGERDRCMTRRELSILRYAIGARTRREVWTAITDAREMGMLRVGLCRGDQGGTHLFVTPASVEAVA